MVKVIRDLCLVISTIIFLISLTLCCTYCFTSINQETVGLASGESNIEVNVELNKLEKSTNKGISGTQFYLFKENGEQIGSVYITDEFGKINVLLKKGNYYFQEITPSLGYTYDEENGEKITKYYFTVNGKKDEKVILNAYNIHIEGSLLISKNILNANGSNLTEEQLNSEFIFTVTFSDNGEYKYKINNGEELTLKSGETIKLKHGEAAVFSSIPTGIAYNITEKTEDGYITNSENHQGIITDNSINAIFTNIYDPEFNPSDEKVKISVTKKLEGEYLPTDENKNFNFTLIIDDKETKFTLKKDETREFEIASGSRYEIIEDDYYKEGYKQEIVNGSGIIYKEDIEVIVTNTYIGEVKKIITGEKSWITNNQNIKLPNSIIIKIKNGNLIVEEKEVKPNKENKWLYEFIVPKYDENNNEIKYTIEEKMVDGFIPTYNGYNITNTYISPIQVEIPTVYKEIYGKDYPNTKFDFALKGKNMPMPSGSENGIKVMSLTGSGELNFGKVTFKNPGVYSYEISELNAGIKGWTYDDKVYKVIITITENNNILSASINWEGRSKDNPAILFTNTYDETVLGTNIIISGTINFEHGNNQSDKQPSSVILEIYANNELVLQKEIGTKDKWKYTFELPKYDENGNEIFYTVKQQEVKNYETTVKGYDVYNKFIGTSKPTPNNPQTGDNIKNYLIALILSGLTLLLLLLGFRKKKLKIIGYINWETDDKNHPNVVTINIYANDELIEQDQISNEDEWQFEYKVPKYDENKDEITYNIEQNELPNYHIEKTRYNIKNKYNKKIKKIKYVFHNKINQ